MVLALFQPALVDSAKELTLPVLATGFLLKVTVDSLIKIGMIRKNGHTAVLTPELFEAKMGATQAILRNQTAILEGLKYIQETQGAAIKTMGDGIAEILTVDRQRRTQEAAEVAALKAAAGGSS